MPLTVDCEVLIYADDTCLTFQHKDVTEIETEKKILLRPFIFLIALRLVCR